MSSNNNKGGGSKKRAAVVIVEKSSREKFDFKFQFHATKVPSLGGWDKLYVGLESTETGKITAKTAKSSVQNGLCRWPDAVLESTRLVHETRSNTYAAKYYKLIVGTNSKRILGEIALNLADYVTAATPASLVLPLKSCSANTVLHVQIHCLTSSEGPNREAEQSLKEGHVSEDEADDSASVTSSITNLPPQTPPNNTSSTKEVKGLARYNSDSSELSAFDGIADMPSPQTPVNARLERMARRDSAKLLSPQTKPSRISLANGEKLEEEGAVQSLQLKHNEQISQKDEEISGLLQERDSLRAEIEQLKTANQFYEEKQGDLMLKLDECGGVIQELKQLLESEKESRQKLETQLRQAEESNVQLARALEEEVTSRRKEVETLKTSLKDQEQSRFELDKAMAEKLQTKDEQLTILENRCSDLERMQAERDAVQQAELEELTLESVHLIYKINMAKEELSKYSNEPDYLGMDDLEDRVREFRKQQDINKDKLATLEASSKRLEAVNSELEIRLKASLEEIQSLKVELQASKSMHEMNMESFSSREQKLKARSDEIHEKYAMTFGLVADLESELEAVKKECSATKSRKEDVEEKLGSLEMLKTELVYQLESTQSENAKLKTQAQEYKSDLTEKVQELRSKTAKVNSLEARITSLEKTKSELEAKIGNAEDLEADSTNRILELELKLSSMRSSVDTLDFGQHKLESKVEDLEMEKCDLEKQLKAEKEEKSKLQGMVGELQEFKARLQVEVSSKTSLEKKVADFSSSVHELQKRSRCLESDNWRLTERIAGLDAQLSHLSAECLSAERRAVELKNEKARMEVSMEEIRKQQKIQVQKLELRIASLIEEGDVHMQARKGLENQVEKMKADQISYRCLQEEVGKELKETCSKLEASLRKARNEHEDAKTSLEGKVYELEHQLAEAVSRHTEECAKLTVLWKEHEGRANRAEELLQKAQLEKSSAVEGLQGEIKRLNEQMHATCGEKEQLASHALVEASKLRGEKLEWEEVRQDLQERIQRAQTELEVATTKNETMVQEFRDASRKRESDLQSRLESAQAKLEDVRKSRAEEYEAALDSLESQRQKLLEENGELRTKELETCQLKSESDACVEKLRGEKNELEATVQRLDALNARFQQDKTGMEDKIQTLSQSLADLDQTKVLKQELEDKVQGLMSELNSREATETEQRIESMRLRKQNSDLRQKSLEHKEERDELRLKIETMEAELKKRAEAISLLKERGGDENGRTPTGHGVLARSMTKSNMKVGVREAREHTDRIRALEAELKLKTVQAETLKKDALQKEMNLLKQIDALETATKDGTLPDHQMTKLRDQVSQLKEREQELVYKLNSYDLLQKERQRLQQANAQLNDRISKFKEASKVGNTLERVVQLETELAEALESNNMYKKQLQSAFANQQNVDLAALSDLGDVDKVVGDFHACKKKISVLEEELVEMKDMYSALSLKFAEEQTEKEQLIMTLRNLKNHSSAKRLFSM